MEEPDKLRLEWRSQEGGKRETTGSSVLNLAPPAPAFFSEFQANYFLNSAVRKGASGRQPSLQYSTRLRLPPLFFSEFQALNSAVRKGGQAGDNSVFSTQPGSACPRVFSSEFHALNGAVRKGASGTQPGLQYSTWLRLPPLFFSGREGGRRQF
jgi:hypothetical protein